MSALASRPRPSYRRIVAFGAIWSSISAAALLAPGCYGRNCEGGVETFGVDAGEGHMVDDNSWESNAPGERWLWFPRQRFYIFDIKALGGRTPTLVVPHLSANPEPNKTGASSTIGAGNLAEFFNVGPNHVDMKNDTCSDYYLRLYIEVPPLPPETPGDASVEVVRDAAADAGADDAAADASDGEAGL